jgi:hypothetical protein
VETPRLDATPTSTPTNKLYDPHRAIYKKVGARGKKAKAGNVWDIDSLEKTIRIEYTFVEDSIALDSLAELSSC